MATVTQWRAQEAIFEYEMDPQVCSLGSTGFIPVAEISWPHAVVSSWK